MAATTMRTGGGFGGFSPTPFAARKSEPVRKKFGVGEPDDSLGMQPLPGTSGAGAGRYSERPSFNIGYGGYQPNVTPTATPTRTTTMTPDPSGAGLVPSGLGGNTLRSLPNERWTPDTSGGLFADTTGASGGAEAMPTIASTGGRSPPFVSDPNEDWLGSDTGWARNEGPKVGTGEAQSDGLPTEPGMAGEPVLLNDPNARTGPSVTVDAGVNSRPPTSPGYMAGFGGNMTLGQFMSTPLAFLRFGENRGTNTGVGPGNVDLTQAGREAYVNRTASGGANTDTTGMSGSAEGYVSPEVEAMSEERKAESFAQAERQGAAETAATTGSAPSSDPASRFGNLNSPTGQAVYRDAQGNWRPVSGASSDIRWDPLSGTGNATASGTTEAYVAGGGDPGRPNDPGSFASEGRFLISEEGAPTMQGAMYGNRQGEFRMGQKSGAPVASTIAYNNWLRQQPEYKAWLKSRGG